MAEDTANLCIFCGNNYPPKTSVSKLDLENLNKFAAQINGAKSLRNSNRSSALNQVSFCEDCLSGMAKASGWREQVEEVERDVRSLQRIILKMLHQLKTLHADYLTEMCKLEGKIRASEDIIGKTWKAKDGRRRKKTSSVWNSEKIYALRNGVLKVVTDLSVSQDELSCHTAESSAISQTSTNCLTLKVEPESEPTQNTEPESLQQEQQFEGDSLLPTLSPKNEEETAAVPLFPEDTLSAEEIDIEYTVYSEDPVKRETDPMTINTYNSIHPDDRSLTTSSSLRKKNRIRYKTIKKNFGKNTRKRVDSNGKVLYGPCQFCGKMFKAPLNLKWHVYTHTGERPFKCPLCPKTFSNQGNLYTHQLYHSGKKRFKCGYCTKGFQRRYDLECHKRKHTGEKPCSCQICGVGLASRQSLRQHIRARHPNSGEVSYGTEKKC